MSQKNFFLDFQIYLQSVEIHSANGGAILKVDKEFISHPTRT
jgi:hypothetical protein